jgi:chromosome segregation ATPase
MSLTNLFAKIAGRHQEHQLARKADFKALVKAVAEEQEPDPEEVERILAESNKSLEDLQRAVELYLLNELAKAERQLNVLHTRRNETEFALAERKRRMADLKEAAYRLEHPQEVTNRDESSIRQQVADLRDRASHHEKEIPALEKTLATVKSETDATEKAVASLRAPLLVP